MRIPSRPCRPSALGPRALPGLLALILLVALPAPAQAGARGGSGPALQAGVGRADITPPTGYVFGGWTRADRTGEGVHTRLQATALVLRRGDAKVALVSVDLFAATGGLVKEAAERNADLGYSERNVLVSASHTHAGPGGYANFSTLNTVAPSAGTISRPETFAEFLDPKPTDRRLYTFLVDRIALAIRQADRTLGPAAAGWGQARLTDVTRNRSLEAHLANHGVLRDRGAGAPGEDPEGALHTVDPEVDVLRVDRLVRRVRRCRTRPGRCRVTVRIPMGGWTMFPNHGTVNPAEYAFYNQDHHGAATRVFEREVRRLGKVGKGRLVVNVYGNGNEGDMSAGLDGQGPDVAERVGRREAAAMIDAWRSAGRRLTTRPALDLRWTRVCFCGQMTSTGPVSDRPVPGLPFLTGSEEGRGPLFELTGIPLEDRRAPIEGFASHGHKIGIPASSTASTPQAVPLLTVRVRDRMIASLPGEPTVEVGRRVRSSVLARTRAAGANVNRVIVAGLANEFILYLTTPEEYERQHYEGGSTLYGINAASLLVDALGDMAGRLVRREPAPEPHPFDPRNGVVADGEPFPAGGREGRIVAQPPDGRRAGEIVPIGWAGAPRGHDRPLDAPFVAVQRRDGERWVDHTDDLWLDVRWRVDADGRHTGEWVVPPATPAGTYRFAITAKRFRLDSEPFTLRG